jgi:peptide/nickel transport system permease protein
MALLVVSHDWDVISYLCDRAIVMYAGQISETGPVDDLLDHSAHPYTRALLACRPRADADRATRLLSIPGQVAVPGSWATGCRFADRCPIVRSACREEAVPLIEVGDGQSSRCLFAGEVMAGTELLKADQ